jgi:hypothetical protein
LVIAVSVAGMLVGGSYGVYRRYGGNREAVLLEPSFVELAESPLEGDTVKVHLTLWNKSKGQVRVDRAKSSCGCSTLVTRGNVPLTTPITLRAGESLPWCASIATKDVIGRMEIDLLIQSSVEGGTVDSASTIRMDVRPGWFAEPNHFFSYGVEPGAWIEREVLIYDAHADPGVQLQELVSSHPDRLKAVVQSLRDVPTSERTKKLPVEGDVTVTLRYRLRVSYLAESANELSQGWLTLVPKDEKHGRIAIPVVCKAEAALYLLSPGHLTFVGLRAGEKVARTVQCVVRAGAPSDLRVLRCPDFAKVDVLKSDLTTSILKVECVVPAGEGNGGSVVLAAGSDSREVANLPIAFHLGRAVQGGPPSKENTGR